MQPTTPLTHRGLAGIQVDDTAISLVEGLEGRLSYRGHVIEELIDWPFTGVVKLVLDGSVANARSLVRFNEALQALGEMDKRELNLVERVASDIHPMQILQGMVPLLTRSEPPQYFQKCPEADPGLVIAARLPRLIAHLSHLASGTELPDYPHNDSDFTRRFLTQLQGAEPDPRHVEAFRVCQILQIEHSFNASTFVARSVASTLAPVENCLSAAFGALHGPLHGGADQAALETADRVGNPERASAFVDDCLEKGFRVMGMGHREYKTLDPRARFVKKLAGQLAQGTEHEIVFDTLVAIEARFNQRMQEKGKTLYANLEFYKGIIYRMLGLQPELFTATFAMARVFGYIAHFVESRQDNRLMRPQARYVGAPVIARAGTAD